MSSYPHLNLFKPTRVILAPRSMLHFVVCIYLLYIYELTLSVTIPLVYLYFIIYIIVNNLYTENNTV